MPIYEIRCRACGHAAEVLVSPYTEAYHCPACGGRDTEKLMSASGSFSGIPGQSPPVPGDTACCGQAPGKSGSDGPGSRCGRRFS